MYTNKEFSAVTESSIRVAALITSDPTIYGLNKLGSGFIIHYSSNVAEYEYYLAEQSINTLPEVLLIEADPYGKCFELIQKEQKNPLLKGLIIVLLAPQSDKELAAKARSMKLHDFYAAPFEIQSLAERLQFLVKFKFIKPNLDDLAKVEITYKLPLSKRIFDILFAGSLIILLSPLMLIVAILIRLESKGPIIYKSKRVGTGYKIFDFYKFRSMRPDADKLLAKLAEEMNQYQDGEGPAGKSAFVKLKNDPRITKVGNFIRNTSIDELPQLFNILKGDMSTVGNRPLPLYEAEMLTSGEWANRFLAPAGLTGLWQVSKRGKDDMSERERKKLDNFYADKHSFWLDMKILLGTIPAVFQKEKV